MKFEKPARFVNRVFLHCSASEMDLKGQALNDEIERWHKQRGFRVIGYHAVVDKEGTVTPGRRLESKPAAQKGHNKSTIALCAHGLYFDRDWYGSAQALAVKALCQEIHQLYQGVVAFWPHNAVNPHKSCPVFSIDQLLELDRWRRMP